MKTWDRPVNDSTGDKVLHQSVNLFTDTGQREANIGLWRRRPQLAKSTILPWQLKPLCCPVFTGGAKMRNQHIRDILYLDCQIKSDPETSPKKSLEWLAGQIALISADRPKTTQWSRDKKRKVFIRDFEIAGRILWLLLYSNDADAPDASFSHFETDAQRDEAKADGEGRPESAHIAICLDEVPHLPFRYLVLAEAASSLPRARVERYLNFLIRQVKKENPEAFKEPDKSGAQDAEGKPLMVKYANSVALMGHLSDEFQREIQDGALTGITLETDQKEKIGFGEGSLLIPVKKQIKLAVQSTWKEKAAEIVAEALKMGKNNDLETARITFASSDKSPHTVLLDTETGDVLNDGFIKTYRLNGLGVPLPEASISFNAQIKARVKILLEEEIQIMAG